MTKIRAVIFDLGNVLVEYSYEPIARALAGRATREPFADPAEVAKFVFDPVRGAQRPFDEGRISPEGFFRSLKEKMGLQMDYDEFVAIWNPPIRPRRFARELVEFLHNRMEMYLLSNTNCLHFEYVRRLLPWIDLMDKWFLSYEMGCSKPALDIYRRMLDELHRDAAELVFLDDLQVNLEPAKDLGMNVVHISNHVSLKYEVEKLFPHLPWERFEGKR